jgi:LuxR family transcriptional regulator, quorum-sensing system regulator SdiA
MMPPNETIVKQVQGKLKALGQLCDTGYLLAMHIRYTRPTMMFTTYPQNWLEHYGEKGMMMVDPVVLWAMGEAGDEGVAFWDDLAGNDPAGVIAGSAAHGLHNGMSFAIGPIASRTIGSITKSRPFTPEETAAAEMLVKEIHGLTDGVEKMDEATVEALRALG